MLRPVSSLFLPLHFFQVGKNFQQIVTVKGISFIPLHHLEQRVHLRVCEDPLDPLYLCLL